jgi:hypothetical protein
MYGVGCMTDSDIIIEDEEQEKRPFDWMFWSVVVAQGLILIMNLWRWFGK